MLTGLSEKLTLMLACRRDTRGFSCLKCDRLATSHLEIFLVSSLKLVHPPSSSSRWVVRLFPPDSSRTSLLFQAWRVGGARHAGRQAANATAHGGMTGEVVTGATPPPPSDATLGPWGACPRPVLSRRDGLGING